MDNRSERGERRFTHVVDRSRLYGSTRPVQSVHTDDAVRIISRSYGASPAISDHTDDAVEVTQGGGVGAQTVAAVDVYRQHPVQSRPFDAGVRSTSTALQLLLSQ